MSSCLANLYEPDVAILKYYTPDRIKLVLCKSVRKKGYEIDSEVFYTPKGTINNEKLENNIARARSKIFEYALCNPWNWFCTFTLNKEKYNRYALEKFRKDFSQYIRDYNKKNNLHIKYLVIPETHEDGAWHMHGFLMGLPVNHLRAFTLEEHLPNYIRKKLLAGQEVYDWMPYRSKFGFTDLEPIRNRDACSRYVTKYISKELAIDINEVGAHLYYCSQGLEKSLLMKRGSLNCEFSNPDFENDYVKIKWFKDIDINVLEDMIL